MAGDIQRRPTFAWQAILILLPVAILATLGWMSIRQDRARARQEATEQARLLADDFADRLKEELLGIGQGTNEFLICMSDTGELLFPPPIYSLTPKPLDSTELTPDQTELWNAMEQLRRGGRSQQGSFGALVQRFVDSNPPERFVAYARYELGLNCNERGERQSAIAAFRVVLDQFPAVVGETGLPLALLARYRMWEAAHGESAGVQAALEQAFIDDTESLCSNLVHQPTILTSHLLSLIQRRPEARAIAERWQRTWDRHEALREVYAAAHAAGMTARPQRAWARTDRGFRIRPERLPERVWLLLPSGSGGNSNWIACVPGQELDSRMSRIVGSIRVFPKYLELFACVSGDPRADWISNYWTPTLEAAEYPFLNYSRQLGPEGIDPLATSKRTDERGGDLIEARVYLARDHTLFRQQRTRARWVAALILGATSAALIGLFAAWRAFQRQLRLNEMKSNFVSSVSHELRAPIASVRLMAESLDRGKVQEPEKQNEYFRFIVQECRRLSSLIENILDFSRIEQGRKQYEFEPTDIVALTQATVKLMEPYAAEKGVLLKFGEHPTSNIEHPTSNERQNGTASIELNVDGKAIQQALVNLIDNAIKHSPRGETVAVEISGHEPAINDQPSTINSPYQPSTINLSVTDRGPGIPREEQEKIFERFYRRGSELRRETQGVGIGLSIVKHVVDAHAGRVRVHSEPGNGSRFVIELPATQSNGRSKSEEHR